MSLNPKTTPFSLSVPTYICSATAMTITLPLGSRPIPAFKVIGRWTTAHQQFNTSLAATNYMQFCLRRDRSFSFSLYSCRCHAWCSICWYFIREVIFCCYWSWLSHRFLIIFVTDECTTCWHKDIDFNSKVKMGTWHRTPTLIFFFFCWSTWLSVWKFGCDIFIVDHYSPIQLCDTIFQVWPKNIIWHGLIHVF